MAKRKRTMSRGVRKHIRREKNKLADKLVNRAIDAAGDIEQKEDPKKDNKNSRHLRLGILISGSGRTMMNILELIKQKQLNAEIAIVISSRPKTVGVEKAKAAKLPMEIIKKKDDMHRMAEANKAFAHYRW